MTRLTHSRYADQGRSGTGLAITIGLHIGIAALALAGLGVINAPNRPPPPIITHNIPDAPRPPAAAPDPDFVEQPVTITVTQPVIDITSYPVTGPEPVVIARPGATDTAGLADTVPTITPQPGATKSARFDPRYAGAAQPPYPPAARRMGEEGTVVVHVRIGIDGRVLESTLAQSSGSPRLDAAALAHALAHWRFTPALKDGAAIEESRDISVRFQLALAG